MNVGDNVLISMSQEGRWIGRGKATAAPASGTNLWVTLYDVSVRLQYDGDLAQTSRTGLSIKEGACCVQPAYLFIMTLVSGSDYYLYRYPRTGGTGISHNISDWLLSLSCNGGTIVIGGNTSSGYLLLYNVENCYERGTFDTGYSSIDGVCMDADNVYYATYDTGKVYKRNIDDVDNNTGSVLATTGTGVSFDSAALCTDRVYVYLASNVSGGAQKITKYNCSDLSFVTDTTLSSSSITRITTDGEYLYYIDPTNSKLVKASCSTLAVVSSVDLESADPDYITSYPPYAL